MSNIAGKAYAMNLITPVYVKTGWLCIFFVPGILCLLKVFSHLCGHNCAIIHGWFYGLLLIVAGLALLLLGFVNWVGITTKFNEFVMWGLSLVFFVLATLTGLNMFLTVVYGLTGLLLLVVGFILLSQGVTWLNKFVFWLAGQPAFQKSAFGGLNTLSIIHYARWVIVRDSDFPRLSDSQPKENLKYGYMLFFSNFNGSWTQYVDSFSSAIPGGLNLIWLKNVGWQPAEVESRLNKYVESNQIATDHYYNAYPLASSNDIKSAKKMKASVMNLAAIMNSSSPEDFKKEFSKVLYSLQTEFGKMEPTPIVSLAAEAIEKRKSIELSANF